MIGSQPPRLLVLAAFLFVVGVASLAAALYLTTQQAHTIGDGRAAASPGDDFQTAQGATSMEGVNSSHQNGDQPSTNDATQLENPAQIERSRPVIVQTRSGARTVWTQHSHLGPLLLEEGLVLAPGNRILIDDEAIPLSGLDAFPLPDAFTLDESVPVHISTGHEQRSLRTHGATVLEALQEAGIVLDAQDAVNPPVQSPVVPEMTIDIGRAQPFAIEVEGQQLPVNSLHSTVGDILEEAGIILGELDVVQPAMSANVDANDTIKVIRVTEELIVEDETLPYQTVYQASDQLDLDSKAVLSNGVNGIYRRQTRVRYEDGLEVSRTLESEWTEQEPVNQVVGYGTKINLGTVDTPEGPREYWRVVHMRVTAYTAASSGKPADHPNYGITASGRPAGTGIVAVDPNVIPFRSEVFVPGYGVGFAGDTGGGVKGRWIDLGYDEDELQTWNGYTDVYYLTPVPAEINYLIPEVLP